VFRLLCDSHVLEWPRSVRHMSTHWAGRGCPGLPQCIITGSNPSLGLLSNAVYGRHFSLSAFETRRLTRRNAAADSTILGTQQSRAQTWCCQGERNLQAGVSYDTRPVL